MARRALGPCVRQAMAAVESHPHSIPYHAVVQSFPTSPHFRPFEDLSKGRWLHEALKAEEIMQQQGIFVSRERAYSLLQECMKYQNLECGRRLQLLMFHTGLDLIPVLSDHLIRLFGTCGSLDEAAQAFWRVESPTEYTWNAIIAAHAKLGQGEIALQLYENMLELEGKSNRYVYVAALQACTATSNCNQGRLIHDQIIKSGLESDEVVGSALVDMYAKCGSLNEAHEVFEKLENRDAISWNIMIAGYVQHDKGLSALECFRKMQDRGIKPDKVTFSTILKACSISGALSQGQDIHEQIVSQGLESDLFVGNTLIDMYAKCECLDKADQIFNTLQNRDIVSWNAIIAGYAQQGKGLPALKYFGDMQDEGIKPQNITFLSVLKSCGSIGAIDQGRRIHGQIITSMIESDAFVGSSIVDMYAKCGSLDEARRVFDRLPSQNVVSWGAIIAGYVQHDEGFLALDCYESMQQEGIKPDEMTFSSILKACGSIGSIDQGRQIHQQVIKSGLQLDVIIGSALVDMYAKCGYLIEAREIFNKLPSRDVISWGAMVSGYAQQGEGLLALECFDDMQSKTFKPDRVVFSSILKACGSIGAIEKGKYIHEQIVETGLQSDIFVGNMLVDMYSKFGRLNEACEIFNKLENRDVASWNAMMAGYAQSGNFNLAMQCLEGMQRDGLKPNDVTFATILVVCSHAGLVGKGLMYYKSMRKDYSIVPSIYHHSCIADLLGRAGHLNQAECLLQTIGPDIVAWRSLLTACRTYGNVEVGRRCFRHAVQLDPHDAAGYVLMSGIYSDACMWKDAAEVEELRKETGAWKKPAKAWIEVNNKVHEFIVGDKVHPQKEEIYAMLKKISNKMKQAGYIPKVDLVLQQMSDGEKEDALCGHCEKLAVAFGLLTTPPGTTIQASKNLRVCMDCHNATKIISKLEGRDIIIKDGYRMHHFKDGACSCDDYF